MGQTILIIIIILHHLMDIEGFFQKKKTGRKIRIKITTNRNVKFITAIKREATISQLANRALSAYLQLTGEGKLKGSKKQLTVAAVKQGIFYMPKSEFVANLLNCDDEVEVVIIKAKPKYSHQIFNSNPLTVKSTTSLITSLQQKIQTDNNVAVIINQTFQQKIQQEQAQQIRQNMSLVPQANNLDKLSKKQKKKQKMRLKKLNNHKQNQDPKINKDNKQSEVKRRQQKIIAEGSSKKKVKLDIQQPKSVIQKMPITMPSPKITFHNEPKIDSPRVSLLNDSVKRKNTVDLQESQKKVEFQKHSSPFVPLKSPLIINRTPTAVLNQDQSRVKNKEELMNFSLPRKLSQDKRIQTKKDKIKDDSAVKKTDELKDGMNSSISELALQKQSCKAAQQLKVMKKQTKLMVVQAQDSESEQNKKISSYVQTHHRQKQINQIKNKINSFYFQLQDDS